MSMASGSASQSIHMMRFGLTMNDIES
jgi:hypothetical protein